MSDKILLDEAALTLGRYSRQIENQAARIKELESNNKTQEAMLRGQQASNAKVKEQAERIKELEIIVTGFATSELEYEARIKELEGDLKEACLSGNKYFQQLEVLTKCGGGAHITCVCRRCLNYAEVKVLLQKLAALDKECKG